MAELKFTAQRTFRDPFNEVTLDAVFTEPGGVERRVPAFWAGGQTWKVRYASPIVGTHKFRTECSNAKDTGLHGVTGAVVVEPYKGDNPLYGHGPLRVTKAGRYLEYADGTPFLWLGDTWWMSLSKRLGFPDEFNTLLADRKKKGFNLVQIVAGLYPDMPAFDPRGEGDGGFPWEKDYARIRPEYFDRADARMNALVQAGIVPCVVGAWGYHLPWLGPDKMKQHERYVYARWGALPIVWCVAGEFNMPFYLAPGSPAGAEKQTADWEKIIRYCRSINAFDRLITAHPTGLPPFSARGLLSAPGLLDFDMLQTGHGQLEVLPQTVNAVRSSHDARPALPVVNAEPSYEMLNDRTPADIARLMFWVSWANGVKGYTYGANGIWQLNGKDKPYGNSPWGGNYGKISWQEAMNLAGSTQVGLGKSLLSEFAWQWFEPHPSWASWADNPDQDVPSGEWIWHPEGDSATDAPVAARYFRKTFNLPGDAEIKRAVLRVTADDRGEVWLNGESLGEFADWRHFRNFEGVAAKLKPGKNVLAVRAENVKADVPANPAGLVGGLVLERADGSRFTLATGADWRSSDHETAGWNQLAFDDAAWLSAKVLAPLGGPPWGIIAVPGNNLYVTPYAFGTPRETRLVYVPKPAAVRVGLLEPGVAYHASWFNPVTGGRHDLGPVKPDARGTWRCDPPAVSHDWVLVLKAKQ